MRDPSTELPAGILAPSFTHAEKAEPGTPNGFQNDIRPIKVQRLSDSQAGFQHENGNVMQRLRAIGQIHVLLHVFSWICPRHTIYGMTAE
jgi:hypothetical protein